jgi:carbon storage regulator CsrA
VGESILLGEDIEVEIVEISRTRVKLGVRAPRHVTVMRREAVTVAAENRQASDMLPSYGPAGVDEVLRLLKDHLNGTVKGAPTNADM